MSYVVNQLKPNLYHIADHLGVFVTLIVGEEKALLFDTGYGIGHLDKTISQITALPLIVVNCLILGRMEAFASKNGVGKSLLDALGMGIGFTFALVVLGTIREILGFGTWFGMTVLPAGFSPLVLMRLPGGAFITLGIVIGVVNYINKKNAKLHHVS